jgi:Fe-S cluster assembly iron-binding protein IscA
MCDMSPETRRPTFPVSRNAIDQITAVGGTVRIDVEDGGCCGLTWVFTQDEQQDSDELFGCPGAVLAVSAATYPLLVESRLDYGARLKPPRYRVLSTPGELCPCRRSFGRPWPGRGQPDCRAATAMPWDVAER